jgi:hypothetical protein
MDSQKEREEAKLMENSCSLWSYILANHNVLQQFLNPFYQPDRDPVVLYPAVDVKSMQPWKSYYFKYLVDQETLSQYKNQYLYLGKAMSQTAKQQQTELQKLRKENEELKQQLEELKSKQRQAALAAQQQQLKVANSHNALEMHLNDFQNNNHLLNSNSQNRNHPMSSSNLTSSTFDVDSASSNSTENNNTSITINTINNINKRSAYELGEGTQNRMNGNPNNLRVNWYDDWVDLQGEAAENAKSLRAISTDSTPSTSSVSL